jgi:hypothetical protein
VTRIAFAAALVAIAGCTRAGATSASPPRADETCGRLAALYAKENLPYEKTECLKMVEALPADDAVCFDACTQSATVKALVVCQTNCRNQPKQ